jgi:biopolymer transport protein ExbD
MLDMAFQLLAFFILTYHPSSLEGEIRLALPAAGQAKAKDVLEVDAHRISDVDIEPPSDLTVVIRSRHDVGGESTPDQYVVESLQGTSPSFKTLNALCDYLQRELGRLKKERDPEIKQLHAKQSAGSLGPDERAHMKQLTGFSIKIRPDAHLKFAFVAEVMDECTRIGFNGVGFAPPPNQ